MMNESEIIFGKDFIEIYQTDIFCAFNVDISYVNGLYEKHIYCDIYNKISGGIQFCMFDDIKNVIIKYKNLRNFATISIPLNAEIYIFNNYFLSDIVNVLQINDISELDIWNDPEDVAYVIKKNPQLIAHVKFQTIDLCYIAINYDPLLIKYIFDPYVSPSKTNIDIHTYESLCETAVVMSPYALSHIKRQTENVILKSVFKYDSTIYQINDENKSSELYTKILNNINNYHLIKSVPDIFQTFDMIKNAITYDGNNLKYVNEKYHTNEIIKLAIDNDIKSINFVSNNKITKDIIEYGLNKSLKILKYIDTSNMENFYEIILNKITTDESSAKYIQYIERVSEKFCKKIMEINPSYVEYINNPPISMSKLLIDLDPRYAVLYDNSTSDELIKALELNPSLFIRIDKPDKKIIDYMINVNPNYVIENNVELTNENIMCIIKKNPSKIYDILHRYNVSENIKKQFIEISPDNIKYFPLYEQSNDICDMAILKDPSLIEYIKTPNYIPQNNVCIEILKYNGKYIDHLNMFVNITDELVEIAILTYPKAIKYHSNQLYEMCIKCIEKKGKLIKYINKNMYNENLIRTAITTYPNALKYMKNQSIDLIKFAINIDLSAAKHINININDEKLLIDAINEKNDMNIFKYLKYEKYPQMLIHFVYIYPQIIKYIQNSLGNHEDLLVMIFLLNPEIQKNICDKSMCNFFDEFVKNIDDVYLEYNIFDLHL